MWSHLPASSHRSPRKPHVATWNVRTMHEAGKTAQVAAEMRNYQLALLRISETRWTQSGQKRLMTGELLLYSGHEEENSPHTQLRSRTHAVMTSTESADRMGSTRTMDHHSNLQNQEEKDSECLNVIQCYLPTNDSDEEDKEQFHNQLQDILEG